MVSISKLLNGGLLLVDQQKVYSDVAVPQQASLDQYSIIRYLGGSGPYTQHPGFGISLDTPSQCKVEQVQMLARHGERYPTANSGAKFEKVFNQLKSYGSKYQGDLAFLNDVEYTYFVEDTSYYEKETTSSNSKGDFAGTENAYRHGVSFRKRYGHLYAAGSVLPVFTSNSGRCYETAQYFANGFLACDARGFSSHYGRKGSGKSQRGRTSFAAAVEARKAAKESEEAAVTAAKAAKAVETAKKVKISILSESYDADLGFNSLTPRISCSTYNKSENADIYKEYDDSFLDDILERFNATNPNIPISRDDVSTLFKYCAYELNVRGESPMCGIFENEEFIKWSYATSLSKFYSSGPGHKLSKTIATPLVEASIKLLQDDEATNKIWISFTHDTDIEMYLSILGLFTPNEKFSPSEWIFPNPYLHANILPQGARVYTEKLSCGDNYFIRFVVNDAVVPIPACASGPGFSCGFGDFVALVQQRIETVDVRRDCKLADHLTSEVSFYWDYMEKNYDAPLVNQ